MNKLIQHLLTA